jgi:SAM-dependent methyltransferase
MKHHAPAAERNREPILSTIAPILGSEARVLEIGSGSGQHAAHFTERMPHWVWQPTDTKPDALLSIEEYRKESSSPGFLPALLLDVTSSAWPSGRYDAVYCANVIHISPWTVCLAILNGAANALATGGKLLFYGPYRFSGVLSPESNQAFDARLRAENPSWGIRDVVDIGAAARPLGFDEPRAIAMPANNHVLVLDKLR